MTVDSSGIFDRAEDLWTVAKLGYAASIPCRYAASRRLAGRISPELVSLLIVIWKSALYVVIDLNEATLVETR